MMIYRSIFCMIVYKKYLRRLLRLSYQGVQPTHCVNHLQ